MTRTDGAPTLPPPARPGPLSDHFDDEFVVEWQVPATGSRQPERR